MRPNGFSLLEAFVVSFVVLVLLAAVIVSLDRPRRTRRFDCCSSQQRGIAQACETFAHENNGYYPGLDSSGNVVPALPASQKQYGAATPTESDQSIVFAILLNKGFFTPDYAVSPSETDASIKPAPPVESSWTITQSNYSHALLRFAGLNDKGRRTAWEDVGDDKTPVVSDRSKAIDPALKTTSLHTFDESGDSAKWEGNVAWNDMHMTFETTGIFGAQRLRIGSAANLEDDDIFLAKPISGMEQENDVAMMYR